MPNRPKTPKRKKKRKKPRKSRESRQTRESRDKFKHIPSDMIPEIEEEEETVVDEPVHSIKQATESCNIM